MTQEQFIEYANKWYNIFLTWLAGTGKSFILNQWKKESRNKVITVAPTWIAAINCWWATIHRIFRLYWDNYHIYKKPKVDFNKVDTLIIDEISMVSCEMFDFIDRTLKRVCHNTKPFWWLQVIVVWDLKQLPPIYNLNDTKTREKYELLLAELWWVEFILSNAYKNWDFKIIELQKIYRSNDNVLNTLLNRIRSWDISAINEFKTEWYSSQFYNSAVHIFPYNKQVDEYNYSQLVRLKWKQVIYIWEVTWEFNLNNVLVPQELKLKPLARIMVSKNLENWLVNWDLWYVVSLHEDHIVIYSDRKKDEYIITNEVWSNIEFDEEWNENVLWEFIQYPLKLASAITAHKVQWLTLDKVIFHYNPYLSNELIYVALSRATSYDNLYVIK